MPKISIIVPVYKAETYLSRCLDSIINQTFKNFEVLLIDDGSPDCSGEICDKYAAMDTRIRVLHKENGGVSSARQMGIDNAKGEYTIHADPDDWVEPNMLEELYKKAKEADADMVISDFYLEYRGGKQQYVIQQPSSLDSRTILQQLLLQQLHGSCWNKLVRRTCFSKWEIQFPKGVNLWEDLWVSCLLCYHGAKIVYIQQAFYHYDLSINPCSMVKNVHKNDVQGQIEFCNHFNKLLINDELTLDSLWGSKASVKILMFRSMCYNQYEIKQVFNEINDKFILQYGKNINLLNPEPFFTSLIIRCPGCYLPIRILYKIIMSWVFPLLRFINSKVYKLCLK